MISAEDLDSRHRNHSGETRSRVLISAEHLGTCHLPSCPFRECPTAGMERLDFRQKSRPSVPLPSLSVRPTRGSRVSTSAESLNSQHRLLPRLPGRSGDRTSQSLSRVVAVKPPGTVNDAVPDIDISISDIGKPISLCYVRLTSH